MVTEMADVANKNKRKLSGLPMCQYGPSCYRKNPEHRKKFRHSDADLKISKKDLPLKDINVENKTAVPGESEDRSEDKFEEKNLDGAKKETADKSKSKDTNDSKEKNLEEVSVERPTFEKKYTETVGEVLKSMPKDFFDFWDFCSSLHKSKPGEAFAELGLHLVGIYDLLSKNISSDKVVDLHCHWRYYYDPPEFQTVVKLDGEDLYHIGYFRDDPEELSSILASNSAKIGPKLTLKGDNIFSAMNFEITEAIRKSKDRKLKDKFTVIQDKLKVYASKKKHCLDIQSAKTKARNKKVVSKTFHGLGIVVPVVKDVGYRPLPDSDATVKSILNKIVSAENEDKRLQQEELLDELITNVQFANDEGDSGMGLELGIDLFCFGNSYFHSHILHLLPLAYDLLKRPKYGEIVKVHLMNRKQSDELDTLDV